MNLKATSTDAERIEAYKSRCVFNDRGCWLWQGPVTDHGYAQRMVRGKIWQLHRWMYWTMKGPFDLKLDLCHTCDTPNCINPDHVWPGTPSENAADCVQKGRHPNPQKTHCPKGHPYAEHGRQYAGRTWRVCKICARASMRIGHGWPEDAAYTFPVKIGHTPKGVIKGPPKRKKGKKRTHCRRGHELTPENSYPKPGGRRQCRICHTIAERAGVERRKQQRQQVNGS